MSDTTTTVTPAAPANAPITPTSVSEIGGYTMEEFARFANIPQETEVSEDTGDQSASEIGAEAARSAATGETDGVPEYEEGISAEEFAEREVGDGEIPASDEPSEAVQDERYSTPKVVNRALATEFTVSSEDGELEVPDLTITYKVAGKDVTDPIDVVVRKAQQGGYNEALQQEVQSLRSQLPELQHHTTAVEQENNRLLAGIRDMLADPNRYLAEYEAYQQQNTPEAQLRASQHELQRMRQEQDRQRQDAQSAPVRQQVVTKISAAADKYPEVPFAEVFGHFNILTAPYLVQGQIPPDKLPQVAHIVDAQLLPWLEETAKTRKDAIPQAITTATKPLADKANTAQAAAIAAKRQVTRALKPQGSASPSSPKPANYTVASDIMKDIGRIATQGIV